MSAQKELVRNAMNAFFRDFDAEKMRQFFSEDYIQHNAEFPTGLAPLIANLPKMKAANYKHEIHRIFEDHSSGELALYFEYQWQLNTEKRVCFDVVDIIKFDDLNKIIALKIIYDTYAARQLLNTN